MDYILCLVAKHLKGCVGMLWEVGEIRSQIHMGIPKLVLL